MGSAKIDRKGKWRRMNKNFFILDNNIFNLKLDAYEFQIYSYLVSCAGKSRECWPSYNTIARMLCVSSNTVVKKINSMVQKQLINKIETTSKLKNGKTRTSNNHYIIRSFDDAWDYAFRFNPSA